MPASALAAQAPAPWLEAMRSVVWRACRVRSAIAVSSSGRLVIASRCLSGSANRVNRFHQS